MTYRGTTAVIVRALGPRLSASAYSRAPGAPHRVAAERRAESATGAGTGFDGV
jgi:hypothetical protein